MIGSCVLLSTKRVIHELDGQELLYVYWERQRREIFGSQFHMTLQHSKAILSFASIIDIKALFISSY